MTSGAWWWASSNVFRPEPMAPRAPVFALCDVNSMYASCEQLFEPGLRGKPVVVLSNGDGCVVARSAEAKAAGVPMGEPWFKLRDIAKDKGIHALSSNYALYASMSDRIVNVLRQFSDELEVYSIDESFLRLDSFGARQARDPGFYAEYGAQMRQRVLQWVGLPTCVGIAPTKTLAKFANHLAKKGGARYGGVCSLIDLRPDEISELLASQPAREVWGIGRKLSEQLEAAGVKTAEDLRKVRPEWAKNTFSVVVERTVRELNGVSCLALDEVSSPKKQIISSRSFGEKVYDLAELQEAVSLYVAIATEKLRGQGSMAGTLTVFVANSPFSKTEAHYARSLTLSLENPSSDTRVFVGAAHELLRKMYRQGLAYRKAGVIVGDISDASQQQAPLFSSGPRDERATGRSAKLMETLDALNVKFGRGAIGVSNVEVEGKAWSNKRDKLSPAYTTRWTDLPRVRA